MTTKLALQTVLATSDGTRGSDAALQTAFTLAVGSGIAMRVFHCVPRRVPPYWEGRASGSARAERIRLAREALEDPIQRVIGDAGSPVPDSAPADHRPRRACAGRIRAAKQEHEADLVPLAPRGRGWVRRTILASVADKVMPSNKLLTLVYPLAAES